MAGGEEDVQDGVGDGLRGTAGGVDGEVGFAVERQARLPALGEAFAVAEDGADGRVWLRGAAVDEGVKGSVEKDDAAAGQGAECCARGGVLDGSAAEGENEVGFGGQVADGFGFKGAEGCFSLGREDFGNGAAGPLLNDMVGIDKAPAETLCEQRAGGRLAGAHEAGKDDG